MTDAKRPLPSLRFVVLTTHGQVLYRLIPQTTPKGRVLPDLWAVPGRRIEHTDELVSRCQRQGLRWRIEGSAKRC